MTERARSVLRGNDLGGFTVPTRGLYPFQWNWDSCLVALGWSTFDEPRAWTEIETLFSGQWPDGMVPHIVFHRPDPGYFPGPEAWGIDRNPASRSEEHTSELQSLMRISYAVFCLKKTNTETAVRITPENNTLT